MTNDVLQLAEEFCFNDIRYTEFNFLYEMYRENVGIERSVFLALHELGLLNKFIDKNWSKLSCISPTTTG
jgi:hypothetical protein